MTTALTRGRLAIVQGLGPWRKKLPRHRIEVIVLKNSQEIIGLIVLSIKGLWGLAVDLR